MVDVVLLRPAAAGRGRLAISGSRRIPSGGFTAPATTFPRRARGRSRNETSGARLECSPPVIRRNGRRRPTRDRRLPPLDFVAQPVKAGSVRLTHLAKRNRSVFDGVWLDALNTLFAVTRWLPALNLRGSTVSTNLPLLLAVRMVRIRLPSILNTT